MEQRQAVIHGGRVKSVAPFFRSERGRAVVRVWSGDAWRPRAKQVIHHYRRMTRIGAWQFVAVDVPARHPAGAIVILEPHGEAPEPRAGDILLFGDGAYTQLAVTHCNLVLESDAAVEVGPNRYPGVTEILDDHIESVVIFHPMDAVIDRGKIQPIWWRGQEYAVRLRT